MKFPKVSIIILNWNGWKDTIECLESLYQITYPNYDVIVVDNGSEDDSVAKIEEWAEGKIRVDSKFFKYNPEGKPIKYVDYTRKEAETGGGRESAIESLPPDRKMILIKNEENYGFAEGNNIGMKYALNSLDPDYVLLLNNDTVVDREFLIELTKVAEDDKKIGIMGPNIYYYDNPHIIASAGGKIDIWKGITPQKGQGNPENSKYEKLEDVSYVSGCAFLMKTDLIANIGMLDSAFFAYWEESDFCMRAQKAGYKITFNPRSKIWHKISGTSNNIMGLELYYMTRNQIFFMKKHATTFQLSFFIALFLIKYFPLRIGSLIFKHASIDLLKIYLQGIWHGLTGRGLQVSF